MAAKEIYDYVSTVTPDYSAVTLQHSNPSVAGFIPRPKDVIVEDAIKNQVVHLYDDESEQVVDISDAWVFFVTLIFDRFLGEYAGTLMDLWLDSAKANGIGRSFPWAHPTDGHVYVVKFRSDFKRNLKPVGRFAFPTVRLKIMGAISDT